MSVGTFAPRAGRHSGRHRADGLSAVQVPDDQRDAALRQPDRVSLDMANAYAQVTEDLGTHIRRELDRRYLVADSPGGPQ